jgi:hypothetical protein
MWSKRALPTTVTSSTVSRLSVSSTTSAAATRSWGVPEKLLDKRLDEAAITADGGLRA